MSEPRPGPNLRVRVPTALFERFKALAKRNRRTLTAELEIAMEDHLERTSGESPTTPLTSESDVEKL